MSRRRRSRVMISLFAFQDIITSVSGIVIVLVLLLTLELIERPEAEGSPTASAVAAQVRQAVSEAERELEVLRATTSEADDLIREVAGTSPAALRSEIADLTRRADQLRAQIEELQSQAQQLRKAERQIEAQRFDLKPVFDELDQLRRKVQELQKQLAAERNDDRLVYALPRGFRKEGWLVAIEAGRIAAAPLGREAKPTVFTGRSLGPLTLDGAADQFLQWSKSLPAGSTYFLLLVRPDGVESFDEIEDGLTERGCAFGFDLIGQHEAVLHPQRGAAP